MKTLKAVMHWSDETTTHLFVFYVYNLDDEMVKYWLERVFKRDDFGQLVYTNEEPMYEPVYPCDYLARR